MRRRRDGKESGMRDGREKRWGRRRREWEGGRGDDLMVVVTFDDGFRVCLIHDCDNHKSLFDISKPSDWNTLNIRE